MKGNLADLKVVAILKVSDNSMILRVDLLGIYSFARHIAILVVIVNLEGDTKVRSISLWKHLFFMLLDFHLGCLKDRSYYFFLIEKLQLNCKQC